MAERRMFAKTIIDSDAFLEMPLSSQALYFHLSMRADDDGFINNPRRIVSMVGANIDDLKLLITKKFVISFENGVIVIKHWRIHNYIRKDTYIQTNYKEQKELLELDENKSYRMKVKSIKSVDEPSTQDRIDKYSKEKDVFTYIEKENDKNDIDFIEIDKEIDKKEKKIDKIDKENDKEIDKVFSIFWDKYPKKMSKQAAYNAFKKIKNPNMDVILSALDNNINNNPEWKKNNGQFIPYASTWLNQKRWEDEITTPKSNFEIEWLKEYWEKETGGKS